jgi:hypothetical protein
MSRYIDWLRAGRPRSRSSIPVRVKDFMFPTSPRPALGPTPSLLSNEYGGLFLLGVKRPGREVQHSPPARAGGGSMHALPHTPS